METTRAFRTVSDGVTLALYDGECAPVGLPFLLQYAAGADGAMMGLSLIAPAGSWQVLAGNFSDLLNLMRDGKLQAARNAGEFKRLIQSLAIRDYEEITAAVEWQAETGPDAGKWIRGERFKSPASAKTRAAELRKPGLLTRAVDMRTGEVLP